MSTPWNRNSFGRLFLARKRVKTSKRWVETGPLAPWMQLYAQWLAGEPGAELAGERGGEGYRARHPTNPVRASKASFFAKRVVQTELVRKLEKRADFRDYFEKLRADTAFHAKELAREQIAANFEARANGLHWAVQARDIGQIEKYTRPYVDHAFPKKVDHDRLEMPRVIIQVGGKEAKRLIAEALADDQKAIPEVEYEVIETKRLTEGEEVE